MQNGSESAFETDDSNQRLSYKFQRLRERLRESIRSGELKGKLPGERELAKRFHVNAKTLSKALTDLAAEGLLERSIGRGTYVRGEEPASVMKTGKWLLLVDSLAKPHFLHEHIAKLNPDLSVAASTQPLRPSDLAGVTGVIDVATATPDDLIRDLLVRNVPTVVVARQPTSYSTHTVAIDRQLGAANLAREMALLGHRHFYVAEGDGLPAVNDVVRQIVTRYDRGAVVEHGSCSFAPAAVLQGVTAIICGCTFAADNLMKALASQQVNVPQQVSVGCAGAAGDVVPCSGYFVSMAQLAGSIAKVLRDHATSRPVNLWLAGTYHDLQTLAASPAAVLSLETGDFQIQPGR